MENLITLSRDEMKNIMAGGGCLICTTPNGTEGWYHDDVTDPDNPTCDEIYPAYNPDEASGGYAHGPCLPEEA